MTTPALFLYKKAQHPLLLCDGSVVPTFRAHRSTRTLCSLRTGTPGPPNGAVAKHGRPVPLLSLVKTLVKGQLPETLHQAPNLANRCPALPLTSYSLPHRHCLRCYHQNPREREARESPWQLLTESPWKYHSHPASPQRGPKELEPPPARHMGKAHRPNATYRSGAGGRGGRGHRTWEHAPEGGALP